MQIADEAARQEGEESMAVTVLVTKVRLVPSTRAFQKRLDRHPSAKRFYFSMILGLVTVNNTRRATWKVGNSLRRPSRFSEVCLSRTVVVTIAAAERNNGIWFT